MKIWWKILYSPLCTHIKANYVFIFTQYNKYFSTVKNVMIDYNIYFTVLIFIIISVRAHFDSMWLKMLLSLAIIKLKNKKAVFNFQELCNIKFLICLYESNLLWENFVSYLLLRNVFSSKILYLLLFCNKTYYVIKNIHL